MKDRFGREITYMRISVTDRCNLRCVYCMPEEGVQLLSHSQILRYEEIIRLVRVAASMGIKKIRLTGGEPTIRHCIIDLVREIKNTPGIEEVAITTNGILIPEMFDDLKDAGLDGVNISIDTLDPDRFDEITRRTGNLPKVLEAIDICANGGINTKVNCVAMKGVNEDEICDIARLAKDRDICVRFIEFMPIGKNDFEKAIYTDEIIEILTNEFGELTPDSEKHGNGPAKYYKVPGFKGRIGVISAMSNCFCEECNRIRLTSDGLLKLCLQYNIGVNLTDMLRAGATDRALMEEFQRAVNMKPEKHTFNNYLDKPDIDNRAMSKVGG